MTQPFFRPIPPPPPTSTLFPYTTLFRSRTHASRRRTHERATLARSRPRQACRGAGAEDRRDHHPRRSEEHTSELQSHHDLVCRLLLEKKKKKTPKNIKTKIKSHTIHTTI